MEDLLLDNDNVPPKCSLFKDNRSNDVRQKDPINRCFNRTPYWAKMAWIVYSAGLPIALAFTYLLPFICDVLGTYSGFCEPVAGCPPPVNPIPRPNITTTISPNM